MAETEYLLDFSKRLGYVSERGYKKLKTWVMKWLNCYGSFTRKYLFSVIASQPVSFFIISH